MLIDLIHRPRVPVFENLGYPIHLPSEQLVPETAVAVLMPVLYYV